MDINALLEAAAHKNVQNALRDLRRAKEMRILIKETIALGDDEEKKTLAGLISTNRPDLISLEQLVNYGS